MAFYDSEADNSDRSSSGRDANPSSTSPASPPAVQRKQPAKQAFSFVNITNPKQAKDKSNRRTVRSHAMQDYNASKKRGSGKAVNVTVSLSDYNSFDGNRASSLDSEGNLELAIGKDTAAIPKDAHVANRRSNARVSKQDETRADTADFQVHPQGKELSRYYHALLVLHRMDSKKGKPQEIFVRDDEMLERIWKAGFVKPYCLRGIGDADPFFVLPQFRNPLIYMAELKMWCTRRFGTNAMAADWIPALARTRLTYLAALCLGATDMDVANGLPSESALTVAVKTEVIELMNEHLTKKENQYTDDNIMAIMLLMCGEIATGNEWTWAIHERGITRMIQHRDGLQSLGVKGNLAVAVHSVLHVMNVLRETQPHNLYTGYAPLKARLSQGKRAIPESPVYCPRTDFYTIVRSKCCSERLYDLLCAVRDLTNDLIDRNEGSSNGSPSSDEASLSSSSSLEHDRYQQTLRTVRLFPAFDAARDAPSYSAWTAEACRITSLIYCTAIADGVPFSEAALLVDAQDELAPTLEGALPQCLHKLRDAVANSSIGENWSEMIGVLFWVTLVGGAAARSPSKVGQWTEADDWTRKYFSCTAMRLMVLLCFEHGEPTMTMLRRLNEVQRRVGRSAAMIFDGPELTV